MAAFLTAFIIIGVYSYFSYPYKRISSLEESGCPINYGEIKCFYGRAVMPVFNPGVHEIKSIELEIPTKIGRDIYQTDDLEASQLETIVLKSLNCPITDDGSSGIKIRWCCSDACYETEFSRKESKNFDIRETDVELESFVQIEETYPLHPEPEDCRELISKRDFCYADVAEIRGDISFCEKISDTDIYIFCRAKVNLSEAGCYGIENEELKNECIRSVRQKKKWLVE
ncbi:MAG: hypothetical protein JSV92_04620 [archaeon]|nr:MAG: hypothetical protein JSV92_04620 [archaeon]